MSEPNARELQKMQRDAEQRLRDMQRRTSQFDHGSDTVHVPNFVRLQQPSNGQHTPTKERLNTSLAPNGQHRARADGQHSSDPTSQHSSKPNNQSSIKASDEHRINSHNSQQKPLKRHADDNTFGTFNKGFNLLKMFNFQNLKLDSDITIIIVLILLISSEETDELLLLALAYIML